MNVTPSDSLKVRPFHSAFGNWNCQAKTQGAQISKTRPGTFANCSSEAPEPLGTGGSPHRREGLFPRPKGRKGQPFVRPLAVTFGFTGALVCDPARKGLFDISIPGKPPRLPAGPGRGCRGPSPHHSVPTGPPFLPVRAQPCPALRARRPRHLPRR